jgi:hypothetical protein
MMEEMSTETLEQGDEFSVVNPSAILIGELVNFSTDKLICMETA